MYIHTYVHADMHVNTYIHVRICVQCSGVEGQGGERLVCLHSEVKKIRLYSTAHHSDVHLK